MRTYGLSNPRGFCGTYRNVSGTYRNVIERAVWRLGLGTPLLLMGRSCREIACIGTYRNVIEFTFLARGLAGKHGNV